MRVLDVDKAVLTLIAKGAAVLGFGGGRSLCWAVDGAADTW